MAKNPRVTVSLNGTMKSWLVRKAQVSGLSESSYVRNIIARAMEAEKYMNEKLGDDMVKILEAISERPEVVARLMDKPEK